MDENVHNLMRDLAYALSGKAYIDYLIAGEPDGCWCCGANHPSNQCPYNVDEDDE